MITNDDIALMKEEIIKLKKKGGIIHIDLKQRQKHIYAESKIADIYDRFFYVTSKVGAYEESFAITYVSILTKKIFINELNY